MTVEEYRNMNKTGKSKYKNVKIEIDGINFDSKKEAARYSELKLLERCHEIKNLELQKKFVLIPSQKDNQGKTVERECAYYADFVYQQILPMGLTKKIVEDVKSEITRKNPEYIIKRKLMLFIHGIRIKEV